MKLRYQHNPFGPKVTCIDDDTYDGAPDAGPQLIGQGETEQEAKDDLLGQWIAKQVDNDLKAAAPALKSWDDMMRRLVFGGPRS